MSGVQIGEVKEVTLNANHEAMITLHIRNNVPIYKNYTFTISTGALVPERYVEVHPMPVTSTTQQFKPGAVTQGLSTPGIQDIVVSLHQMLAKLQNTADSLNQIIGDPEVITSTKAMVQQLEIASREAAQMMLTLEALSRESAPDISRAVDQLAQASAEASKAIYYLSQRIETSSAPDDLEAAVKAANESLQNARDITAELKGLLGDKELQGDFRVADDHGKHVVEVVGHAPGQAANGLHFPGLNQLVQQPLLFGFGPPAFGNINIHYNRAQYLAAVPQYRGGIVQDDLFPAVKGVDLQQLVRYGDAFFDGMRQCPVIRRDFFSRRKARSRRSTSARTLPILAMASMPVR